MVSFSSNSFIVLLLALLAVSTPHLSCGAPDERKLAASLKNKDIPWKDLVRKLSKKAKLIKGSTKAFAKQCDPGFDKPRLERNSGFDIVQMERTETIFDAKSGLCLDSYACAFKDCLPGANHSLTAFENVLALYSSSRADVEKWKDPRNPEYDLPASVLFPKTAGDIVAAVEFANDNKLELSVKSSGHNFSGQSSKKDTLLLNTKRFQNYAATGIVECDASASSEIQSDLSNQPCVLALARNKKAYIRVATGESFLDSYGAVHDFNEAQEKYKYHMVGGAAPTVTPMGWTFQGGLAGSMGGRRYGYGVDQVLMIEAVLPTGEFVRFGPTSFEDAEGFLVPKTLAVSGVCNQNPFDDEESWVWGPCAKDINFDDLWYAFRGGGGGTYGIATSLFLQLHEHEPLELISWFPENVFQNCSSFPEEHFNMADYALNRTYAKFRLDFILEPSKVGVSEEDSAFCGSPGPHPELWCYGEGSASKYINAWKQSLEREKNNLMARGIPASSLDAAGKCFENKVRKSKDAFLEKQFFLDPPTVFPASLDFDQGYDFIQFRVIDFDRYKYDEKSEAQWLSTYSHGEYGTQFYHAVGGVGSKKAHDQTSALPSGYRTAAFYATFSKMSILTSELKDGYTGQNHMQPYTYGPLKEDYGDSIYVKPCPLDKLTFAEADELCYSHQVSVWGPERLARLEKIKATVDPNHILNCYKCVGYKKDSIAEFKPPKKKPKKSNKSRRAIV